jgi:phospholipase D3/4
MALRADAFRGVQVHLLFAMWNYTSHDALPAIESLSVVTNITVRWFVVPPIPPPSVTVPYTRVNHAKFMVTDEHAYVGTSNWSYDYFYTTGGVSFNTNAEGIVQQLQAIFDRDWNSQYTVPVTCTPN